MKRLFVLTNIPTPYRNHFFNCLHDLGDEKNLTIKVYYMAETEKGRFWNHRNWQIDYKYLFLHNFGVYYKGLKFHFNPSIIFHLIVDSPHYLVVAGSWNFPTVLLVMAMKFLYPKIKIGFWNEGNFVDEVHSKKKFFRAIKQWVYNRFDYFVSSGYNSDQLIQHYTASKPVIRLVNIIEESKFKMKQEVIDQYKPKSPRLVFSACTINERKNIFFFVKSIEALLHQNLLQIRIAGEGNQKEAFEQWIVEKNLMQKVQLLGHLPEKQVVQELWQADIFCLASQRDPFPLSLIEALFASKPLLISEKIGSVPEIIVNNGVTFNPIDVKDIEEKTKFLCNLHDEQLLEMGNHSKQLADFNFTSKKVIVKFLDDLNNCL